MVAIADKLSLLEYWYNTLNYYFSLALFHKMSIQVIDY